MREEDSALFERDHTANGARVHRLSRRGLRLEGALAVEAPPRVEFRGKRGELSSSASSILRARGIHIQAGACASAQG